MQKRVHEVAKQHRVSTKEVLAFLASRGLFLKSASSKMPKDAERLLSRVSRDEIRGAPSATSAPVVGRPSIVQEQNLGKTSDGYWATEPWESPHADPETRRFSDWIGPEEITAAEAAEAYPVTSATVRQWVRRGHIQPVRRGERPMKFEAAELFRAWREVTDRKTQQSIRGRAERGLGARRLRSKDLDVEVTAEVAARVVDVAVSTVRSWQHRGHLRVSSRAGRTPLYRIADVLRVARRAPYKTPRRQSRPRI